MESASPTERQPAVPAEALEHTIRHTTLRGVGFIGLLGVALIHLARRDQQDQ